MLERVFHLKARGTNVKTEVVADVTTFATMAYILAVNPGILSASGMDFGKVSPPRPLPPPSPRWSWAWWPTCPSPCPRAWA